MKSRLPGRFQRLRLAPMTRFDPATPNQGGSGCTNWSGARECPCRPRSWPAATTNEPPESYKGRADGQPVVLVESSPSDEVSDENHNRIAQGVFVHNGLTQAAFVWMDHSEEAEALEERFEKTRAVER